MILYIKLKENFYPIDIECVDSLLADTMSNHPYIRYVRHTHIESDGEVVFVVGDGYRCCVPGADFIKAILEGTIS